MDMLNAMRVAVDVARLGSFHAASRELGLSPASVSRLVADLEADLGVRLFNRTTRQLNLTDAGEEFVRKGTGLLEELDHMRWAVRQRHEIPRGRLRVSSVAGFGTECLAPALPRFMQRFPELSVSLDIGNRLVDLIEERYDVAIRVGPLHGSAMVARKIFSQKVIIVASRDFCLKFGMPKSHDDLKNFPSVMQISGEWGRVHQFTYRGKAIAFEVPQHCTMNSASAVRNACLTGYGYSLLPDFMVREAVETGRLVRLLPDYEPAELALYAFYPERRYLPQKIRVFVDYLAETFGGAPPQLPQRS